MADRLSRFVTVRVSAVLAAVMVVAAALAVATLPLIALVVSLHPAWRATRIDAAEVLPLWLGGNSKLTRRRVAEKAQPA